MESVSILPAAGVKRGLSPAGDHSHLGSVDRQDSDGDDSDSPVDEDDEEEEDSQAESGLSTNPSVSASPQHVPPKEAAVPPSALLAQMSISSLSLLPTRPSDPLTSDSVPAVSPVSRCSPAPLPTFDSYTSDPESVHMMSPVSPCRQMSIDYPDFEVPLSPPVSNKTSKSVQVRPPTSSSGFRFRSRFLS